MAEYFASDRGGHGPYEIRASRVPKVGEETYLPVEWTGSEWVSLLNPFQARTGPADYVIWRNSSVYFATPTRPGLNEYSNADAYTVIQSAITSLTPYGKDPVGGNNSGGKIHINISGQIVLSNELIINGWEEGAIDDPRSQLIFGGNGFATQLYQPTENKNVLKIQDGACIALRDIQLFATENGARALFLSDEGAHYEMGCLKSEINNVECISRSAHFPAVTMRNFFELVVPKIHVENTGNHGLVIENTSTTTNYGNSHFGFIRLDSAKEAPYAAIAVISNKASKEAGKQPNLIDFDYIDGALSYYGIYGEGMKWCKFGFVDMENTVFPIYFENGTEFNEIKKAYLSSSAAGNPIITCAKETGGNTFNATITMPATTDNPILDESTARPPNNYVIQSGNSTTDTALGLIKITNPQSSVTITKATGAVTVNGPYTALTNINTTGKTSEEITTAYAALFNANPPSGAFIVDETNKLVLYYNGTKWFKSAALTEIA